MERRRTPAEALGFHRDTVLPEVPEGKELVKFHGEPALISKRDEGEPLAIGQFTERQANDLIQLEQERLQKIREALEQERGDIF